MDDGCQLSHLSPCRGSLKTETEVYQISFRVHLVLDKQANYGIVRVQIYLNIALCHFLAS